MQFSAVLFFAVCLFFSTVSGQELSRSQKLEELKKLNTQKQELQDRIDQIQEQSDELAVSMFEIDEADKIEAEKYGADSARVFPDRLMDKLFDSPDSHSFSVYPFTKISNYYFAPKLEFANNLLKFNKDASSSYHGFIINVGQISLDSVNDQIPALTALEKYKPPVDSKDVKTEFASNGLRFENKAVVSVGETYLVRAIEQRGGDGLFALKVHRKDEEGSIVIFVKLIKRFELQIIENGKPNESKSTESLRPVLPDAVIYDQCRLELDKRGFVNVQIKVADGILTAKGTAPKGRLGEGVLLLNECGPQKINNQLTEEFKLRL